jgi:hypothetical protein
MVEIDSLHLMALIELLALLFFICVIIGVRAFLRGRREQAAIEKLVSAINEDKGRRQEETRRLLENRYGYEGDELQAAGRRIARQELGFYQLLINLFIKRNTQAMERLNLEFETAVAPYRELGAPKGAEPEAEEGEGAETTKVVRVGSEAEDNSAEIERLKRENQRLMEELEATMKSLSRMLNEYAGLVGEDKVPEDIAKVVEAAGDEAPGEELEEIGDIALDAGEAGSDQAEDAAGDLQGDEFDEIPDFDEILGVADTQEAAPEAAGEEPGWDEALDEQASAGEAAEEEPSWDEALNEQASSGEAVEEEPSWDEALNEQASSGEAVEEEPSWDEALDEQASSGEAAEEEPSWDEALQEQTEKNST